MELKRVLAFDEDDLIVMSAHLEGARVLRSNLAFLPQDKRFVLVAERRNPVDQRETHLSGLHFDRVEKVKTTQLPTDANTPLTLIGITFEPDIAPSGTVVLIFENHCAIRLDVECLEASLSDLSALADPKD